MKLALKVIGAILLNISWTASTYGAALEQREFNFKIDAEKLLSGDVHYSYHLLSPRKTLERFPLAADLDSLSLLQERNVHIMLTKKAYVVKRPVGFYDNDHIKNKDYMKHIMGQQELREIDPVTYKVRVPGKNGHTYKIKSYFDSDDISTLPSSRIIQAVSAIKRMDVLSQSASSIILKEYTDYSDYLVGGTEISSYITLKENSTIIITYNISAVRNAFAKEESLKKGFVNEVNIVNKLIKSYKKK
jgi:hypothetical protein